MSQITVTGNVERKNIGPGTWALVSDEGQTYELKNAPQDLCQSEGKVKVNGQIREDVMTFAMIGPILEVESFEKVGA